MVNDAPANRDDSGEAGFDPWVRKIPWRRKQQPTPVFLPEKSHGQRSLTGYSPWGLKIVRHNLATKQETRVQSLGLEAPLEKEMATHSGILAWEIPWTEEPGRLQFLRLQIGRAHV